MIVQNTIQCRGFSLCIGHMSSGDVLQHQNSGDGIFNQFVFLHAGSAVASSDGKPSVALQADVLTDLTPFAGSQIIYVGGENGALWTGINPTPDTKRYSTQLIDTEQTVDVPSSGEECAIVCLSGVITVNDKQIPQHKYARVLPNRTVRLSVPANATALILKSV